jgi:hypothetical protein
VIVAFVPLTERSSVDLDDSALDDGVGPDEFVVGRVVDNVNDAGLPGRVFGSPSKVSGL